MFINKRSIITCILAFMLSLSACYNDSNDIKNTHSNDPVLEELNELDQFREDSTAYYKTIITNLETNILNRCYKYHCDSNCAYNGTDAYGTWQNGLSCENYTRSQCNSAFYQAASYYMNECNSIYECNGTQLSYWFLTSTGTDDNGNILPSFYNAALARNEAVYTQDDNDSCGLDDSGGDGDGDSGIPWTKLEIYYNGQKKFDKHPTIDVGHIAANLTKEYTFTLKNTSDQTISISSIGPKSNYENYQINLVQEPDYQLSPGEETSFTISIYTPVYRRVYPEIRISTYENRYIKFAYYSCIPEPCKYISDTQKSCLYYEDAKNGTDHCTQECPVE